MYFKTKRLQTTRASLGSIDIYWRVHFVR